MLTGLTAGLTNKNTILAYAKDIDMKHLYASLAGKTKGQTKSYLVEKNLDQFLPQQNIDGESILMKPYADYSVEEKMYTVSALLLERISMQGTHDLENMDEGTLIQLMITYLIYP